jgi:uncharacterized Tic20 family protein
LARQGRHSTHRRGTNQPAQAGTVDPQVRNTAVAAHLSTLAGLVVPFGSVIGRWRCG